MKKSDLKSGMVVEYRDGRKRLVINDDLIGNDGCSSLTYYNDDLKDKEYSEFDSKFDIIKVYRYKDTYIFSKLLNDENLELVWERKDIKLTNKEIEILKALKTLGLNWIARDEDGDLNCYNVKPYKVTSYWDFNTYGELEQYIMVHDDVFNFVKWENDEPTSINELLKGLEK